MRSKRNNDARSHVPPREQPRVREIVDLTDAFCQAHLNDEFRELCRRVAAAAVEAELPLSSGKAAGWAAGIVAAVGFANFLGDTSQPVYMTMEEIALKIGVSAATLHNKAKVIRDALDITRFDPRFTTQDMTDQNPFQWILTVNGISMDIRTAPRGAQVEAFRRGLIPYIPEDGRPGKGKGQQTTVGKPRSSATSADSSTTPPAGPPRVYTLDVSLLSGLISQKFAKKNKSIVRTIQIRGDQTLEELHNAIFDAFGRDDPHMYEFQMGKSPMDPDGPRYVLPMAAGDEDFGPSIAGTVDVTTIDSMGLEEGRQFGYWFDFGDDWYHQIGVEKVEATGEDNEEYPRVIRRIGESPPQYMDDDETDG